MSPPSMAKGVEYARLRTAIGVAEVEVEPLSSPSLPVLCSSSSSSCPVGPTWGFGLEQDSRFGFTQVSWSNTPSVRPRDVILAVNGRPVMDESKDSIVKLIEETLEEEKDEKEPPLSQVKTCNSKSLKLTLDTRRSWPKAFLSRHGGGGEGRSSSSSRWGRRLLYLLEGFDTALLDAQVRACTSMNMTGRSCLGLP